jgi:hypothetical protein
MGQVYWDRLRATINKFWQPGEELRCTRIYTQDAGTCQMCSHHPIKWHHVLHNQRTGADLIVGKECINNYKVVTGAQIVFLERLKRAADYLNGRYPDCVLVLSQPVDPYSGPDYDDEPDWDEEIFDMYDELELDLDDAEIGEQAAEGLDPDEYDWDSHDYDAD